MASDSNGAIELGLGLGNALGGGRGRLLERLPGTSPFDWEWESAWGQRSGLPSVSPSLVVGTPAGQTPLTDPTLSDPVLRCM
jgi:hypothetical protein